MNSETILTHYRRQLASGVLPQRTNPLTFKPVNATPWLAMSTLQKAIRRGRSDLALGAAATLHKTAANRLWRRLSVTAYEDVGVADFDTVALVTSALKGKRFRERIGGEWSVASWLVTRMCQSAKCRAADDLAYVCERHPGLAQERLMLTFEATPALIEHIVSSCNLEKRALALWNAVGVNSFNASRLRERKGEPQATLDALCDYGLPDTLIEVCREGYRKSGEIMSPLLILLHCEFDADIATVKPDKLPPEELIGETPSWAFDMHTREGRSALTRLQHSQCEIARWLRETVPPKKRTGLFGHMVFRVEGGCVDRRLRWAIGDELRRKATFEIYGLKSDVMVEGLDLLRKDIPHLNEERRHVSHSNSR